MHRASPWTALVCAGLSSLAMPLAAVAQEPPPLAEGAPPPEEVSPFEKVKWKVGPTNVVLGTHATLAVPEGYRFADPSDTKMLMEAMGNVVDGSELGLFMPDEAEWFVTFRFDDVGYIKDAEKEKLDADEILASIKEGNDYANEERRKNGWPEVQVIGWDKPPFYDVESKNLEWSIKGASEGHDILNYNTRLLGRKGVMKANLVVPPDQLAATLPVFKTVLGGFDFKEGSRYAEYRDGDKIAEYGLAALVTGGAAAVAAKSGLLAKLGKGAWKLIILVGAGLAALGKKLFGSTRVTDGQ